MNTFIREQDQRQKTYETQLSNKVMELKREFRNIQLKRELFYE